ncbi:hypothetical protein [Pseudochrobactrum lubricantis]|uniref:hypothetical protein n=1 Tax=Pseudochrobactrum lubricantis TaxID=558172 RepID=UPI0035D61E6E
MKVSAESSDLAPCAANAEFIGIIATKAESSACRRKNLRKAGFKEKRLAVRIRKNIVSIKLLQS